MPLQGEKKRRSSDWAVMQSFWARWRSRRRRWMRWRRRGGCSFCRWHQLLLTPARHHRRLHREIMINSFFSLHLKSVSRSRFLFHELECHERWQTCMNITVFSLCKYPPDCKYTDIYIVCFASTSFGAFMFPSGWNTITLVTPTFYI